ncbi:hypothetical protein OHA21_19180 [Actinoplanes sp. NBC_00393]|uniref:hypothetical protein n=1 Tax=Actinoplanes sp. NBC_00393 TaxID=2975953 RepID=UPI002E1AC9EC
MSQDPLFHTILATDVAKSSSRNDDLLLRMRADLRKILIGTLSAQQIDAGALTVLDDGDGFRFLLPATVAAPHALIDPFLSRLGIELRRHRLASSTANRLRLRVALHMGLLFGEDGGSYTGVPLKDCARLLDAPAGRELLDDHPDADMVVLLTDSFHRDVITGGTSLDPAWFRRIPIRVKETDSCGWAYLPAAIPVPKNEPAKRPRPTGETSRSSTVNIQSQGNTSIGTVIGGDDVRY